MFCSNKTKHGKGLEARYTVQDIARMVGITVGSAFTILKKILKVKRLTARWIPHLLTDEQKQQRVETTCELLKLYPKYSKNVFSTFVTGDQAWVHFFEPQRKVNNKIWATKNATRPCVAKRLQRTKKVMYSLFFHVSWASDASCGSKGTLSNWLVL